MKHDKQLDFQNDFLEDDESIFVPTPKKTVTPEEVTQAEVPLSFDELICKEYKLGMTLKQITEKNGISYGKVYEILNRMGVKLRHGRYASSKSGDRLLTMSPFEKASLISDYKEGLPTAELLSKYDINKHGLYSILDAAGIPRRHKQHTPPVNIGRVSEAVTQLRKEEPEPEEKEEPMEQLIKAWYDDKGNIHLTILASFLKKFPILKECEGASGTNE